LLIVNDGPYGNERPYNALRVAMNLAKREEAQVRMFLIGDGVQCAIKGQGWLTPRRADSPSAPRICAIWAKIGYNQIIKMSKGRLAAHANR